MKLQEVTGYNSKTASILKESYQDLTEGQIIYLNKWEKELWPLVEQYTRLAEAELTKAQIMDIFNGAEKVAMDSGDNKTLAGKAGSAAAAAAKLPVDMAKAVDEKIKELGAMAKQAGPIKDMDAKFRQLKADITAKNGDSKIVQGIQKVSDWAKENPGKASLAVGILTTVASFAGGPAGGLAAGLIFRSTNDLLQGKDLSSAIGNSVKTAAYGAIAGWALNGIGDWLEGLRYDAVPYDKAPGLINLDVGFEKTLEIPGYSSIKDLGSMVVPADQVREFTGLIDEITKATAGGATSNPAALNAFDKLWDFTKSFDVQEYIADMNFANAVAKQIAADNDSFLQNLKLANDAIAAVAQGTITGKMDSEDVKVGGKEVEGPEENPNVVKSNTESLSMEEKYELYLQEGPMDALKKAGSRLAFGKGGAGAFGDTLKKGAAAVGGAVKQAGKDLGNKVTANKLMKMWKSMGEPLDSGSIANILQDAGMSDEQIKSIGQTSKVALDPTEEPAADASGTDTAQNGAQTDEPTVDTDGDGKPDAPAAKKGPAVKDGPIEKGTIVNKGGKDYEWAGALWLDTATKKPLGVQASFDMGLPNPKFQPIIDAAKKDPELAKLIKDQLLAKGVKAATADAQKAAQAGVKGTEKLKTA